jgi:hypothetical protein
VTGSIECLKLPDTDSEIQGQYSAWQVLVENEVPEMLDENSYPPLRLFSLRGVLLLFDKHI